MACATYSSSCRRVDRAQALDDLMDPERHVLAPSVPETHDVVCAEALDRVVERVQEHPAAELAIGHDVQAEVNLPPNGPADRLVLELRELRPVLGPLLRKHR